MINRNFLSLMAVVVLGIAVTGCSKEEMDDTGDAIDDASKEANKVMEG